MEYYRALCRWNLRTSSRRAQHNDCSHMALRRMLEESEEMAVLFVIPFGCKPLSRQTVRTYNRSLRPRSLRACVRACSMVFIGRWRHRRSVQRYDESLNLTSLAWTRCRWPLQLHSESDCSALARTKSNSRPILYAILCTTTLQAVIN